MKCKLFVGSLAYTCACRSSGRDAQFGKIVLPAGCLNLELRKLPVFDRDELVSSTKFNQVRQTPKRMTMLFWKPIR